MRKLVLGIIFATMHACCGGVSYAQTYLEKQSVGAYNLLTNPGFENGKARWTTAAECDTGTRPYGQGVRSITCTGVTSAKTLFEQSISVSNYIPYIDDLFKSSIHIVANSPDVQVCMLFNGAEEDCQPVVQSANLNAAGYKEVIASKRLTGLAASFTIGIRIKTVGTTTTAINADAAYVGPWKGWVGIVPNSSDWQPYTPTFNGFGTVVNNESYWRRVGENVELDIKFQAGTATAVEARVGLPTGLATKTFAGGGLRIAGAPWIILVGQAGNIVPLAESGSPYIVFSIQNASNQGFAKLNGSSLNSGNWVSFKASVPIQGWTANTTAQVYGLVPWETLFSAEISATRVVSNQVPRVWLSDGTGSGQDADFTFINSPFTVGPQCWTEDNGSASSAAATRTYISTSSGLSLSNGSGWRPTTVYCRMKDPDYTRARGAYENVPMSQWETVEALTHTSNCTVNGACPNFVDFSDGRATSMQRTAAGAYRLNFKAGTYSGTPFCTCSGGTSGGNVGCQYAYGSSTADYAVFQLPLDGYLSASCRRKK